MKGKPIRRSLETQVLSVAKLQLGDLEKEERQIAKHATAYVGGKMTFGDALAIYRQRLQGDASLKPRTKEHREERIQALLKTWPSLGKAHVPKITKQDCLAWAASYASSAEHFNKTVRTLRLILEIPIESGIRYDNPARFIKTMKVRLKPLQLPAVCSFLKSSRAYARSIDDSAAARLT